MKVNVLPPLYAIVDVTDAAPDPLIVTEGLLAAGVELVQLRAKHLPARRAWELAVALRELTRAAGVRFAVNDRPDLAAAVEADVLHLGQDDMPVAAARRLFKGVIGLSTHNPAQVRAANEQPVDYIGFGPVFATATKENPDPVTGLDGLREVVAASRVPVVAIGGITLARVADVLHAGAASVAVISALAAPDRETVSERTQVFLAACRAAASTERAT